MERNTNQNRNIIDRILRLNNLDIMVRAKHFFGECSNTYSLPKSRYKSALSTVIVGMLDPDDRQNACVEYYSIHHRKNSTTRAINQTVVGESRALGFILLGVMKFNRCTENGCG